jgi:hypothetical protein
MPDGSLTMSSQALIMAHNRQKLWGSIAKSVAGVIFLGTPHRGAEIAYWGALFSNLANFAVAGNLRSELLKSLEPKSKLLGDICEKFVERAESLQIISIYERWKLKTTNTLVGASDFSEMFSRLLTCNLDSG